MYLLLILIGAIGFISYSIYAYWLEGKFPSYSQTYNNEKPYFFMSFMSLSCLVIGSCSAMLTYSIHPEMPLQLWQLGVTFLFLVGIFSCGGKGVVRNIHLVGAALGFLGMFLSPGIDFEVWWLLPINILSCGLTYITFKKSKCVITYVEAVAIINLFFNFVVLERLL